MIINIIGAGFAGSEAALQLAHRGFKVNLFEMRPYKSMPPFGNNGDFAYPVCSNSLKSFQLKNAHGLFKAELLTMGSFLLKIALKHKIPAGKALAIDRHTFSNEITNIIENNKNINVIREEALPDKLEGITIIAAGPLASKSVLDFLYKYAKELLFFYDAVSPIISFDSIDMNKCFFASRYNKGKDYINCPLTKDDYDKFYNNIINAEKVSINEIDKNVFFEGCLPIEEIARRGYHTPLFSMMKPVGISNAYAIIQLRKENKAGTMYNIVGFQTRLKFNEQKRIIRNIPGLENAEILRYGVIHKNTYINSPELLNDDFSIKENNNFFLAGQIIGTEGYVEAISSGLLTALSIICKNKNKKFILPPKNTITGSLFDYILHNPKIIKPMNANFGLLENYNKKHKIKIAKNCIINAYKWKGIR